MFRWCSRPACVNESLPSTMVWRKPASVTTLLLRNASLRNGEIQNTFLLRLKGCGNFTQQCCSETKSMRHCELKITPVDTDGPSNVALSLREPHLCAYGNTGWILQTIPEYLETSSHDALLLRGALLYSELQLPRIIDCDGSLKREITSQ